VSETELPAHLTSFLTDLQADPTLIQSAKAAVGELEDAAAIDAAAAYYQSKGYQINVEELTALEIARKEAVGETLSDDELEAMAGGAFLNDVVKFFGKEAGQHVKFYGQMIDDFKSGFADGFR
jgi:hypothetical protein